MIAQVQREGEFVADGHWLDAHLPVCVADSKKSRQSPAFSLEGVDRQRFVTAATGVDHMILKAACRSLHPGINYIEFER
jgi:hypothetical protein